MNNIVVKHRVVLYLFISYVRKITCNNVNIRRMVYSLGFKNQTFFEKYFFKNDYTCIDYSSSISASTLDSGSLSD